MASDIMARVEQSIVDEGLLDDVSRLHVGFSGGADSTALLVAMSRLHRDLIAVHLHHGLRGEEADRDAAWCEAFCRDRGLSFRCVRLDVPAERRTREGLEAAARRCRLDTWQRTVPAADAVALGHHADDVTETFFLRLVRGANASGLTGLRARRRLRGVLVIRPLLCLKRREIEAFLAAEGITDWRRDSSNRDLSLRRNQVRRSWLPLIRQDVGQDAGLRASLRHLAADADLLESLAGERLSAANDAEALRRLHPALLPRVLRLWLRQELGRDTVLRASAIERIRAELAREPAGETEIPLDGEVAVLLSGAGLKLRREPVALGVTLWAWGDCVRLDLPGGGSTLCAVRGMAPGDLVAPRNGEWFAGDALPGTLTVRAWRPGDRMVPFGRGTPKKLQDLFTNARVPRSERSGIPVVLAGETIVWVPGVCRAEFGRVAGRSPAVRLTYSC